MRYQPSSRKEAESIRYGAWAGHPKGNAYNPKYCAARTMTPGRGSLPTHCSRKPGHGPDGIYCKEHAIEFFPTKEETWYETSNYSDSPKEVIVVNSSKQFVWLKSGDSARKTSRSLHGVRYWPSLQEANAHIISRLKSEIEATTARLKQLTARLKKLDPDNQTKP